jgi:hypothetical protein
MKDVTVLKHGKFNLFSILKMLTQGWKLVGDREQIGYSRRMLILTLTSRSLHQREHYM